VSASRLRLGTEFRPRIRWGLLGSFHLRKTFTQEDAELLEMLASNAAAALIALEHARLECVLLAARTAQHELNNQLAVARGYAEMLVGAADLPPHLHQAAEEVMNAADDAANIVRQLRNISHIHEQHWHNPADSTINLDRSQDERTRLLFGTAPSQSDAARRTRSGDGTEAAFTRETMGGSEEGSR